MEQRTRILLVEDEAIIALSESSLLEEAGFTVEMVHSGGAAVERATAAPPVDLVLMDIDLGRGMDGTEAAARILESRELPIVFLTSHSEQAMVERVKGITRYGYVLKNAGRFVLVEAITMALELFRSHQQTAERERRIRSLNRTHSVLSEINQTIVRARDVDDLYQVACRIVVEKGEFMFAWVGVHERERNRIVPAASHGAHKDYLSALHIDLDEPELARGPTAQCYQTAGHVIVNDLAKAPEMAPWKTLAAEHGFRASAAFPIVAHGSVQGVFGIYAPEPGFFDEEEVQLLDELARDIGFALEVEESRARAATAEESRKEWEHLMGSIVRHDPSAIAVLDSDLRFLYVSDRFLDDYGVDNPDIIGRHHYEVFPDVPRRWREVHQRALQGEVLRSEDDFFVRTDGSVDYTRWECRPWRRRSGEIGGIVLYTEIVTRTRLAESEHHRLLASLRSLLQNSPDLISIVDVDGHWRMVSDSVARTLGVVPEEVEGRRFDELLPPQTASGFFNNVTQVAETGAAVSSVETVPGETGVRHYRTTLFPAQLIDEQVVLVGVISVDITEEQRARDALEASEAKYRRVISTTSFGFWIVNGEGRILEANEAYGRMTGYRVDELCGMHITDLDVDESPESVRTRIRTVLDQGSMTFEAGHQNRNGTIMPVAVRAGVLDAEHPTLFGIVENISDRKEAERLTRESMEERELLLRESHHRVKNDMQIVEALLALQADQAQNAEAETVLNQAADQVNTMTRLYNTTYLGHDVSPTTDITELVGRLVEDAAVRFGPSAPEFRFDPEPVRVTNRASAPIAIIVNELITNAVKYAFAPPSRAAGGPSPRTGEGNRDRVTVTIRPEAGGMASLTVHDNGTGLPDAVLAGRRNGFGYTMIAEFVNQIGGKLSLLNDPQDGGATVVVRFSTRVDAAGWNGTNGSP